MCNNINSVILGYNVVVETTRGKNKMSFARSREEGLYVCHRSNTNGGFYRRRMGAVGRSQPYKDIWIVRSGSGGSGGLIPDVGDIIVPSIYAGKRVRIKIEVVEDEQNDGRGN